MALTVKDMLYEWGRPFDYIKSHPFGLWHIFVESVNMSYIDCNSYLKSRELPIRENNFELMTFQDQVFIFC